MGITSVVAKGRQVKSTAGEQSKIKVGFDVLFCFLIESDLNIYKTKGKESVKRREIS